MADDSIAAVPQAMRDGSLCDGRHPRRKPSSKVLVPAALPGIVCGHHAGHQPRHWRDDDRRHGGRR